MNSDTGEINLLASDLPSWDGMFTLNASPSGSYGAYQDLSKQDGPVVVFDFESGNRKLIEIGEPGEGQSSFLLGWTPEGLLVVSIAQDGDVIISEGQSTPAGSVELRFYDVEGNLRFKLTSLSQNPDDRIVQAGWTEDDNFMFFTLGPVLEEDACSCYEQNCIQHANSLWIAQKPKSQENIETTGTMQAKYIGPLAGKIHEISILTDSVAYSSFDSQSESAVEVWYWPSDDSFDYGEATYQFGARFLIDNESGDKITGPIDVQRTSPFDLEHKIYIGNIGDNMYYKCQGKVNNQILQRILCKAPSGEAVIWEGESYITDTRIMSETLVFQFYETWSARTVPDKIYLYIVNPGG